MNNYKTSRKDDKKTFYWIKLMVDFFHKDTIDYLMGQKDGSNYVVLYMMLMLMTTNTNGRLETQVGEIIIKTDIEKIVRDTKYFNIDTVRVGLELFNQLGLVYKDQNGTLVLPEVPYTVGKITGQTLRKTAYEIESGKKGGNKGGKNYQQSIEYRDKSIDIRDIEIKDKDIIEKTISQNVTKKETKTHLGEIKQVIDYFNETLETRLTYKNENINSLIRARLNEGVNVDDFKMVIKSKFKEWKDNEKMKQYIRPSTLFTSKFHEYLAVADSNIINKEDDNYYNLDDYISNK